MNAVVHWGLEISNQHFIVIKVEERQKICGDPNLCVVFFTFSSQILVKEKI